MRIIFVVEYRRNQSKKRLERGVPVKGLLKIMANNADRVVGYGEESATEETPRENHQNGCEGRLSSARCWLQWCLWLVKQTNQDSHLGVREGALDRHAGQWASVTLLWAEQAIWIPQVTGWSQGLHDENGCLYDI